jgi:hypothetical protein
MLRGRVDQDGFGSRKTGRGEVHVPKLCTRTVQDCQGRRSVGALPRMATEYREYAFRSPVILLLLRATDGFSFLAMDQVRAILMNASQLASYDVFKRMLLSIQGARDGPALQFGASFLAGTVATSESIRCDLAFAEADPGRSMIPRICSHLCARRRSQV